MSTTGTPFESAAGVQPSQRLHPSSLLFSLGTAARRLLIPGIVVLAVNPGNRADLWLMVFFVPAAVGALLKYLSYRYRLGNDELVIREGIVTRNERHIPYSRVQNIDLVQNPVHRLFGVAEVRLETAGGEKPEAVIKVLSLHAVDRMRAHVFREREAAADRGATLTPEAAPRRLVALSLRELLLLGLLSNRGLALAAAAMGVLWQVAPDSDWVEGKIKNAIESAREAPPSLPQTELLPTWLIVVGGAILLLLLFKLLSVAWIVLKYYGFTLTRRGDDLRAVYGLLTRVSATIPRRRIQVLSTRRGPLQRWLRRVSVQVETAGGREGDEGSGTERLWLAPQMAEGRLSDLLAEVLPEIDFATLEWHSLQPRARWRVFRKTWRLLSLLVLAVSPFLWPWGLLLLLPVPLVALVHSTLYVRYTGYATNALAVFYRSGWLRRRVSVVRFEKIQVVSLRQTPFDRRARMASVCVDTAGAGRIGHPVEIDYLDHEAASRIFERLSGEAGRTDFRW